MSTILCIDDEPMLLEQVVETLEDEGFDVLQAGDGAQGLRMILEHGPDLVICDVTMPRMDGYALFETLRRDHPGHADTPFIFLSALADRHDVMRGLGLGADEYLTKPVDFELLVARTKACLRQFEGRLAQKAL
jgi:DNA-binding response OmpR family regulator